MNKKEFLEILKDYLKKNFSEDEINDILRDYEEYFLEGVIEGKSDIEIIAGLGSPKSIANELISETKNNYSSESSKSDNMKDQFNVFKLRAKDKYNDLKVEISEKLTPNIQNNNHNKDRKWIQVILAILSLILIIPAFTIIMTLVCIGIGLVGLLVVYLVTAPFIISFVMGTPQIAILYIFVSITFIGGQIFAWQLYIFVVKLCKKIIKQYINWLKTRNLYINASKKKEKYDNKEKENVFEEDLNDNEDEGDEGDEKYE
ncbi:DUF1700 domain-containing protein [Romboutsia sedimentorum]|uniref:DUF1700 domain-containing protein n=1 Tax=Romboutsia sedimentorum TaxID=1368474 RepID=A0ABT7E9I8_9FIRM|nr:DUF1700 domain-containing protein [Romboutsia sedimentorum]MDK2563347.1 DUF1700 domain-containing protein [Romboutsia sedimentorum]